METVKSYENYPIGVVILSNLVSLSIYGLGFIIVVRLGLIVSLLYVTYISIFEYRLLRYHCVNCFYWGKTCGFGKGRLSSIFFKRGDLSKFCAKDFSWKDLIPDLLITLIPLAIGIYLLIAEFDIIVLMAMILLIILTTMGNGFIRGQLTCKYCKQRELGCLAEKLFNKKDGVIPGK
ncbi:MAG TPA: hypothetical protein VGK38_08060 [Prolixibacteraceae bacterium]